MTKTQYRKAIEALGLNQIQAAHFLGVTERTSRTYAATGAPDVVEIALFVMIHCGLSVDDVNRLMKRKEK